MAQARMFPSFPVAMFALILLPFIPNSRTFILAVFFSDLRIFLLIISSFNLLQDRN